MGLTENSFRKYRKSVYLSSDLKNSLYVSKLTSDPGARFPKNSLPGARFPRNSDPGARFPKNSEPGALLPKNSEPGARLKEFHHSPPPPDLAVKYGIGEKYTDLLYGFGIKP